VEDPYPFMLANLIGAGDLAVGQSVLSGAGNALEAIDGAIFSPTIDTSTTSTANVFLAGSWQERCLKEHSCGHPSSSLIPLLPTRIINVADPLHPCLEDGCNRRSNYVTISYKWGTIPRYTTSRENERSHRSALPVELLPRTFRDAISVTSQLGFSFLWIDPLCIVQDDVQDLANEIGRMGSIYQHGDDANSGLGVERDALGVKPRKLDFTFTFDNKDHKVSAHLLMDRREEGHRHLDRRGWALQEKVLARRILNFGPEQLTSSTLRNKQINQIWQPIFDLIG
jgi:hypothetical protein